MEGHRFAWADLYAGNRFLRPVSETSLAEAGRAAGLREGCTVLEPSCGNAAALLFLAEEFHVYGRGIESSADLMGLALKLLRASPAGSRVRLYHEDASHPAGGHAPPDAVCCLRRAPADLRALVRPGGRCIVGCYVLSPQAPPELGVFPTGADRLGEPVWRHEATPLEWERFLQPQERVLRAHLESRPRRREPSPIALMARARIEAFRAHSAHIAYELAVYGA